MRFFPVLMMVALTGLMGCGGTTTKATLKVEPGMTKAQVLSMLGEPRRRSFSDGREVILYDDAVGFARCAYVMIWFENDEVLTMKNITRGCFGVTAPPNWDQMPEPKQANGKTDDQSPVVAPDSIGKPVGVSEVPARDKYDDIGRLKRLLDDGALTQEEFDREKAKILSD